jgi:tetratricopeptide (TPR) repeat protein
LKALIEKWAANKKVKNFAWNFIPSCHCLEPEQRKMNAIYYDRRGLFHLSRGNPEQALSYLREAFGLDESNADIRKHYAIALAAVRQHKQDSILEEYLVRRGSGSDGLRPNPVFLNDNQDRSSAFRIEYLTWMLDIVGDIEGLEKELGELTILGRQGITQEETTREWSYSMAIGQEHTAPPNRPVELYSRGQVDAELPGSPVS